MTKPMSPEQFHELADFIDTIADRNGLDHAVQMAHQFAAAFGLTWSAEDIGAVAATYEGANA